MCYSHRETARDRGIGGDDARGTVYREGTTVTDLQRGRRQRAAPTLPLQDPIPWWLRGSELSMRLALSQGFFIIGLFEGINAGVRRMDLSDEDRDFLFSVCLIALSLWYLWVSCLLLGYQCR